MILCVVSVVYTTSYLHNSPFRSPSVSQDCTTLLKGPSGICILYKNSVMLPQILLIREIITLSLAYYIYRLFLLGFNKIHNSGYNQDNPCKYRTQPKSIINFSCNKNGYRTISTTYNYGCGSLCFCYNPYNSKHKADYSNDSSNYLCITLNNFLNFFIFGFS